MTGKKEILKRLTRVQLLVMDVDGVLTDSGMYYTENGDEFKKFNTRDGKGIELVRANGLKTGIITSEERNLVQRRAEKLRIDFLMQGIADKEIALRQMAESAKIDLANILYIGDDVNDIPAIKIAGISACPSDAVEKVRQQATLVLETKGGYGAVRELCDLLLDSFRDSSLLSSSDSF